MTDIERSSNQAINLDVIGAARFTGIPVGTLRFYRSTNQGPRSYLIGNRLRYDVADLQAWMDVQKDRTP